MCTSYIRGVAEEANRKPASSPSRAMWIEAVELVPVETINATKYNSMMLQSIDEMNAALDDGETPFTPESYEAFQLSFGADQSPQSSTKRNRKAPMIVRPVKRSKAKLESEFGSCSTAESPASTPEESYWV